MKYIEIEQMLFGDYRVNVWDDKSNSLLDREYFCHGYESAYITALGIKQNMFKDVPIYYRKLDETKKIED